MIRDNKVLKYLLYAIGEIILVVIGILIAISINNSNELKKTRVAEKIYLKEIKSDLIQDTLLLSQVIKDHKWRIAQLRSQDTTIDIIFEEIIGKLPTVDGVSQLEYIFFTLSVKVLPFERLSSSTLHTIIFGFMLNNPMLDKNFFSNSSFTITSLPSFN